MLKLSKVTFKNNKKEPELVQEGFFGLSIMQANWGPINQPVIINKTDQLQNKFDIYDDVSKNDWLQAYNFLSYTDRLKVYRVGDLVSIPSFTANILTNVYGSSNAHLFLNSENDGNTRVWNDSDNGAALYIRLNDMGQERNEPTYGTDQILFAAAKYTGLRGNEIGLTIANYYTDLNNEYVFKEFHEITVADASGLSVDETITGETSLARGTIKRIVNNKLYVDVTFGTFQVAENIDNVYPFVATETSIVSIIENDDENINYNYTLAELFGRSLRVHEIGVAIIVDNEIKDYGIFSLNLEDDNAIELWENDWVIFKMPEGYSYPLSTMTESEIKDIVPIAITNTPLQFGASDEIIYEDIANQLERLKDPYFCNFAILFCDVSSPLIKQMLDDIKSVRDDVEIIINTYDTVNDDDYLVTNEGFYIITNDNEKIIVVT